MHYRICHYYDSADKDVYLTIPDREGSADDVIRMAVYVQLKAEDWFEKGSWTVTVSNLGVATALSTFLGGQQCSKKEDATTIDMFYSRELLLGSRLTGINNWVYPIFYPDESLKELIRPFVLYG